MSKPVSPVLIVGARSDVGIALAHEYARQGCEIILAARRSADLADDCSDLAVRYGVAASAVELDVTSGDPDAFFAGLGSRPGTVVMVVGLLGDQDLAVSDDRTALLGMESNFVGPARYLLAAARVMEAGSTIIGISSVAGDRGRGSNLVYGSAKAGFTAFLSGLRNRLTAKGIHVLTVRPGFIDTKMTAGMNLPKPLTASPAALAKTIVAAHQAGRNDIYSSLIWRAIMLVIRTIPEPVFKKMNL